MDKNRARKRKPLWLRVLIGLGMSIPLIIFVILVVQVCVLSADCDGERNLISKLRCGISATYESDAPFVRCLPTDEEMIANFHKNRGDFERLVNIYREDLSVPTVLDLLKPTPEIKEIMARINVAAVKSDGIVWVPPDPWTKRFRFLENTGEASGQKPHRRGTQVFRCRLQIRTWKSDKTQYINVSINSITILLLFLKSATRNLYCPHPGYWLPLYSSNAKQ